MKILIDVFDQCFVLFVSIGRTIALTKEHFKNTMINSNFWFPDEVIVCFEWQIFGKSYVKWIASSVEHKMISSRSAIIAWQISFFQLDKPTTGFYCRRIENWLWCGERDQSIPPSFLTFKRLHIKICSNVLCSQRSALDVLQEVQHTTCAP